MLSIVVKASLIFQRVIHPIFPSIHSFYGWLCSFKIQFSRVNPSKRVNEFALNKLIWLKGGMTRVNGEGNNYIHSSGPFILLKRAPPQGWIWSFKFSSPLKKSNYSPNDEWRFDNSFFSQNVPLKITKIQQTVVLLKHRFSKQ